MKINATRFVSEPPETPFAPVWDYTLAQTKVDIDLDSLAEYILIKEKEIVSEYPGDMTYAPLDDGKTNLGEDSLTARFKYFNVFKWDHPECKKLLDIVSQMHVAYHRGLTGGDPPKVKIRCWANVLRKDEQIGKHNHATHPHTYISGHFCVTSTDTSTIYIPPYSEWGDEIVMENIPGEMTLFPTWLTHYTSRHKHDKPRITLAFDIVPAEGLTHVDEDNLVDL